MQKNKVYAILAILALLSISFYGGYVYAQTSTTFTISSGIYPESTFTVWVSGSNYYAKNDYGAIPSWGSGSTNASYVINNAVTEIFTYGGSLLLKRGTYSLDSSILIPAVIQTGESKSWKIRGESLTGDIYYTKLQSTILGTVLEPTATFNGSIFDIGYNAAFQTHVENFEISHLTISGTPLPDLNFGLSYIKMDSGEAGIKATNIQNAKIHDIAFVNCYYGLYLTTSGSSNDMIELNHLGFGYNLYGVRIDGGTNTLKADSIYGYINYRTFMLAGGKHTILSNIWSNVAGRDQTGYDGTNIRLESNGLIVLRDSSIQNAYGGVWSGANGLRLILSVVNASIIVENTVIQGVNGSAIRVMEANRAGYFYFSQVLVSPSPTSYYGGEGRNNGFGIDSDLQNSTGAILSVEDSIFKNDVSGARTGNFTKWEDIET